MSKEININIELVLEAIKDSGAVMSTIADRLGVSWHTAKKQIDKHEETQEAYRDEEEITLDKAESALHRAIEKDDIQAAKWLLATKGKKRGYSEKHQVEHSGQTEIVYLDKQDEEL